MALPPIPCRLRAVTGMRKPGSLRRPGFDDPKGPGWGPRGGEGEASVLRLRRRRTQNVEMPRAQVEFDHLTVTTAFRKQVDVNLVGPEHGAAMANVGQVERRRRGGEAADGEHAALTFRVAADEDEVGGAERRAIQQRIDRVDVTATRRAGPELEALHQVFGPFDRGRVLAGLAHVGFRPGCPDLRKIDDTRTHHSTSGHSDVTHDNAKLDRIVPKTGS